MLFIVMPNRDPEFGERRKGLKTAETEQKH